MDIFIAVGTLIVLPLCLILGLVFFSDCDLLLWWKSHFGVKIDALSGKVVWITGASSGIGEFLAYELAKVGCRLILSARRQDELDRVKKECLARGCLRDDDVLVMKLDGLDFKAHQKAVDDVLNCFGKIDILVNNAGRSQRALIIDTSLEVDREMMELNVFSVLSLTKAVLPHMIVRKRGHIVVTSSVAGKLAAPFSATYSATKYALQGWFDALRIEQYANNISVTMVCPGPVFSNALNVAFTGESGKVLGYEMQPHERRVTTERCAKLMAIGIANKMNEVWISLNPVLFFLYFFQYAPTLAQWFACIIGLKTVKTLRGH